MPPKRHLAALLLAASCCASAVNPDLPMPPALENAGIDWESEVNPYIDSSVQIWIGSFDDAAEELDSYSRQDLLKFELQNNPQVKALYQTKQAAINQAIQNGSLESLNQNLADASPAFGTLTRVKVDNTPYLLLLVADANQIGAVGRPLAAGEPQGAGRNGGNCQIEPFTPVGCPGLFQQPGTVYTQIKGQTWEWQVSDRVMKGFASATLEALKSLPQPSAAKGQTVSGSASAQPSFDPLAPRKSDLAFLAEGMAKTAIFVDGSLYFQIPSYSASVDNFLGNLRGLPSFAKPAGASLPTVGVVKDGKVTGPYLAAEHLKNAGYTLKLAGDTLTLAKRNVTVTQRLTRAQKPVYSMSSLKKAFDALVGKARKLDTQRPAIETNLARITENYSFVGYPTADSALYTAIPKGNTSVLLLISVKEERPTTWNACAVELPAGFRALRAATLNGSSPYFRILSPNGEGGQVLHYVKGAPLLGTQFSALPRCSY